MTSFNPIVKIALMLALVAVTAHGADMLVIVPETLQPVSTVVDPALTQEKAKFQGVDINQTRTAWVMRIWNAGNLQDIGSMCFFGDKEGRLTAKVVGSFARVPNSSRGPVIFADDGAYVAMSMRYSNRPDISKTYDLIAGNAVAGTFPESARNWGLSSSGGHWWVIAPGGETGDPPKTFVVDGKILAKEKFMSWPENPSRLISRDGEHVAFAAGDAPGFYDIIVDQKTVLREVDGLVDFAWSHDGKHYAMVVKQTGVLQTYLDGAAVGEKFHRASFMWMAPSGAGCVVCGGTTAQSGAELFWNGRKIADCPCDDITPRAFRVSPSGRWIAIHPLQGRVYGQMLVIDLQPGDISNPNNVRTSGELQPHYAVLDGGTVLAAGIGQQEMVIFRNKDKAMTSTGDNPFYNITPSPDGHHIAAGHGSATSKPIAVDSVDYGEAGERLEQLIWSPDSQYLAAIVRDAGDKRRLLVNGTKLARADEFLAVWFDGVIAHYIMRRGDNITLNAVSLDGKELPAAPEWASLVKAIPTTVEGGKFVTPDAPNAPGTPAVVAVPAIPAPPYMTAPSKPNTLPASMLGAWSMDTNTMIQKASNLSAEEWDLKMKSGEIDQNMLKERMAAFATTRMELTINGFRIIKDRQAILDLAYGPVATVGPSFKATAVKPPNEKLVFTPTGDKDHQKLMVTIGDKTLLFERRP